MEKNQKNKQFKQDIRGYKTAKREHHIKMQLSYG